MISRSRPHGLIVPLVLSTVVIQLIVAVALKQLADAHEEQPLGLMMLFLGVAVVLNGLRFLIWGYTHKHYPLSHSYPLTALFFPCILAISLWYGDTVEWQQILAVGLIMAGVVLMNWESSGDSNV